MFKRVGKSLQRVARVSRRSRHGACLQRVATRWNSLGLALITIPLVASLAGCWGKGPERERRAQIAKENSAKAAAMFAELCKNSGEKIYRTVSDVHGIVLLRVRPETENHHSQFGLDDPYGMDLGGDGYIMSLLRGFSSEYGRLPSAGYDFVDVIDQADGKRYRVTMSWGSEPLKDGPISQSRPNVRSPVIRHFQEAHKVEATASQPTYGVTYRDISTPEQKQVWVAGSSLQVVDLDSNEVIAERVGYMRDPGMGAIGGGRSPWLHAADVACPPFEGEHGAIGQRMQTSRFVHRVLIPARAK